MSNVEIKIVTKTCITCALEPTWNAISPSRLMRVGECKAFPRPEWKEPIEIFLDGQVALYGGKAITDCPLWAPKLFHSSGLAFIDQAEPAAGNVSDSGAAFDKEFPNIKSIIEAVENAVKVGLRMA